MNCPPACKKALDRGHDYKLTREELATLRDEIQTRNARVEWLERMVDKQAGALLRCTEENEALWARIKEEAK